MHKAIRLFIVLVFAVSSLSIALPAQALPRDFVEIYYYDCDWNLVGEEYRDCSGTWYSNGNPSAGRYREIMTDPCSGFGTPQYWVEELVWGGTWGAYDGNESSVCYCERTQGC